MLTPKFAVGDRVVFLPEKNDANITLGLYTIVRVLPWEHGGFRYQVKSDRDQYERVMREAQLTPSQPGPQPPSMD